MSENEEKKFELPILDEIEFCPFCKGKVNEQTKKCLEGCSWNTILEWNYHHNMKTVEKLCYNIVSIDFFGNKFSSNQIEFHNGYHYDYREKDFLTWLSHQIKGYSDYSSLKGHSVIFFETFDFKIKVIPSISNETMKHKINLMKTIEEKESELRKLREKLEKLD